MTEEVRTPYPKAKLIELALEMINDGDDYVLHYGRKLLSVLKNQGVNTNMKGGDDNS